MVFIAWLFRAALQRWRSQGLPEKSRNCSSNSLGLSLEDLSQTDGSDPDPIIQMLASSSQLPSPWRAGAQFGCHSVNISCCKCPWTWTGPILCRIYMDIYRISYIGRSYLRIQPPSLSCCTINSLFFPLELCKTSSQCLTSCGSPKHARTPLWNPPFPLSALSTAVYFFLFSSCPWHWEGNKLCTGSGA